MARRKTQRTLSAPRRGDVYLVRFGPPISAEMRKTRPAVIVQNDVGNRVSPVIIVAAITSQVPSSPSPIQVVVPQGEGGLELASVVLLNYVYSFDRRRLIERLGTLRSETVAAIDQAIMISLGLVALE